MQQKMLMPSPRTGKRLSAVISEARPEAYFSSQRDVLATTRLQARQCQVAVCKPRQILVATPGKRQVPRHTDIKVGIDSPHPEPPKLVDHILPNALPRQLRCKGRF